MPNFNNDPRFQHLRNHIDDVARSLAIHNQELENEVDDVRNAISNQHAYARHGWQTGWASQVLRTLAGKKPDQAFNPYGCDPAIRSWGEIIVAAPNGNVVSKYGLDANGRKVIGAIDQIYAHVADQAAPLRSENAGHFISPMAQQKAMRYATADLNYWAQCDSAERRKAGVPNWHKIRRMAIKSRCDNTILGLGFSLNNQFSTRSEEEVRWLIQAFENKASYRNVMDTCPFSSPEARTTLRSGLEIAHSSHTQTLRAVNPTAFPQLADFFTAVGLEIKSNYEVMSVWDQNLATGRWRLVTAYAIGDANGPHASEVEMTIDGNVQQNGALTGNILNNPPGMNNPHLVFQGRIKINR